MLKKWNAYRIKERLVRGFVVASGIPAVAAVVTLIVLIVVAKIYAGSLHDYGFAQGDVGKTMAYFAETRSALRGCIGYDDAENIESMRSTHDRDKEMFAESFAALEASMVSDANKEVYQKISDQLPGYWELEQEILELGSSSDEGKSKEAQDRAIHELMPVYDSIYTELSSIMDIKVERGDSISGTMTVVCTALVAVMAVTIILCMVFSIRLGRNIAESISRPMIQLGDRLQNFAKGDLLSPFPTADTKDEVADMIGSANEMATSLSFIISDMENILGKMASSDYTVMSQDNSRYIGDLRQLFESSKQLKDCMVETMHFIEESSQ